MLIPLSMVFSLNAMEAQNYLVLDPKWQSATFEEDEVFSLNDLGTELATHESLEKLVFNNVEFSYGVGNFCRGLSKNTSLRRLLFTDCKMHEVSMIMILQAVQDNKHIQSLDFWSIRERSPIITRQNLFFNNCVATPLANLIQENKSLKTLYVYQAFITDEGGKEIASALKKNRTLRHFQLGFTKMTDEGVTAFFDALENNKYLETLNLNPVQVSKHVIQRRNEKLQGRVCIKIDDNFGKPITAAFFP